MVKLLFLCGYPGCGKTTVSQLLKPARTITPGAWLREILSRRSLDSPNPQNDLSNYVSNNWSNDVLEPLVIDYIETQIADLKDDDLAIIEGFPRTLSEADYIMNNKHFCKVVVINLSREESLKRCSVTRKRTHDDNLVAIEHRLQYWEENSQKILSRCQKYVEEINVDNLKPEQVVSLIQNAIQTFVVPPTLRRISAESDDEPPSTFWVKSKNPIMNAQLVQMQLRLCNCSKRRRQFCGSHPISLTRETMPRLLRFPYLCALKIDGLRFFCLIRDSQLWFLNRKLEIWTMVSGRDPRLAPFNDSLLDGELASNNVFVVIDVLAFCGVTHIEKPIIERLATAARFGQMMYHNEFCFRVQEYVDRTHLQLLLERGKSQPFQYDGVIFQPAKLPARQGIDYNLFKYKSLEKNTVDLLLGEDGNLYCRKSSEDTEDDVMRTIDSHGGVMLSQVRAGKLSQRAICAWLKPGAVAEYYPLRLDNGSIEWVPQKPRWDKPFPNLDWVVDNILGSAADNISEQELIYLCAQPSDYK